eukprot:578921-Alexandrium_andersonii.AAC.1
MGVSDVRRVGAWPPRAGFWAPSSLSPDTKVTGYAFRPLKSEAGEMRWLECRELQRASESSIGPGSLGETQGTGLRASVPAAACCAVPRKRNLRQQLDLPTLTVALSCRSPWNGFHLAAPKGLSGPCCRRRTSLRTSLRSNRPWPFVAARCE